MTSETGTGVTIGEDNKIFVFGGGDVGNKVNFSGLLYSFKLYDNGILVVDMFPARRNSDGVIGMYDATTNIFYENQGTGGFITGPTVPSDAFGAGVCVNVGAGYYSTSGVAVNYGDLSEREACPAGTYGTNEAATSASECLPCTGATYNNNPGASQCRNCPGGYDYNTTPGKTLITQCQVVCGLGEYVAKGIPEEYTQLAYIEPQGKTFIRFYYTPQSTNIKGNFKIGVTSALSHVDMIGISASSNRIAIGYEKGAFFEYETVPKNSVTTAKALTVGETYVLHFESNGTHRLIQVDDSAPVTANTGRGVTIGQQNTMYLFDGGENKFNFTGHVYYFKLYDNDVLVREMYPVRRNSDGELGMWDMVTETFYTKQGSGSFKEGPVDASDFHGDVCDDVGPGYWSPGNVPVNFGEFGGRTACPAGLTTVGYGHGADEAADCGHLLKFDGHAIYSRTSKPTTPALNFMTSDGTTFYIGLSSTDNTLSKLHVSDGTNQYTAYDDSLIYGERQF